MLVRSTPWLLEALRAARDVDPPDWLVGGGLLRDLVWDRLHGRPPAQPRDLDLALFDPARLDPARDAEVEAALAARPPGVPWDAKSQAAVQTWYPRVFGGRPVAPVRSAADGVATWPETATAVAVRLLPGDHLRLVAPCGLDDLFGLVCRRNPRRVTLDHYHRRLRDKAVTDRLPRWRLSGVVRPMPRWTAAAGHVGWLLPWIGSQTPSQRYAGTSIAPSSKRTYQGESK